MLALSLLGCVTSDVDDRARARLRPSIFPDAVRLHHHAARSSDGLTLGVAGTIGLVWGALGFFGAISTAVNYAWGVEKQRSFWRHKLFSFVMLGLPA